MLGELASSNAAEIQLQLNADRGGSLSKSSGVVKEVVELAESPVGPLKNATVKGNIPGFEGERTVSLQKHTVKATVRVDANDTPLDQLKSIGKAAIEMVADAVGRGRGAESSGPPVFEELQQREITSGDE